MFSRRGSHDPQARITHIIQECVKLAALRGLLRFFIWEENLIHRYVITGDKLIEDLESWMLPLVLNIGKAARRNAYLVTYHFVALSTLFSCGLNRLPKSIKIIKRYWSFHLFRSLYYIVRFTFFGYVYTIPISSLYNFYYSQKAP